MKKRIAQFAGRIAKYARDEARKEVIRLVKLGIVTATTVKPFIKAAMQEVKKEIAKVEKTARKEAEAAIKKTKPKRTAKPSKRKTVRRSKSAKTTKKRVKKTKRAKR